MQFLKIPLIFILKEFFPETGKTFLCDCLCFESTEAKLLRHNCSLQAILFQSPLQQGSSLIVISTNPGNQLPHFKEKDSQFLTLLNFPSELLTKWLNRLMVFHHHLIFRIHFWDHSELMEKPSYDTGIDIIYSNLI